MDLPMERIQFCVYKNILGYASEPSIELKTIKLLETIKNNRILFNIKKLIRY